MYPLRNTKHILMMTSYQLRKLEKADDGSHNLMLKTASAIPSKKLSTDITRVMMEKRQNTSSPNKPTAPSPESFATANEMSGFTDDTLLNPHNPLGHQRDDY